MGSSLSNTRCDSRQQPGNSIDKQFMKDSHIHMEAPPTLQRPMSFEEKVYAKVCFVEKASDMVCIV